MNRARVLLLAEQNRPKGAITDGVIHQILDVSLSTIARIRQQFSTDGLSDALDEKPRPGRPIKFGGDQLPHDPLRAVICYDERPCF